MNEFVSTASGIDEARWRALEQDIRSATDYALNNIRRPAKGCLKHEYLVPAGPYEEQWDWDAFFMALALMKEDAAKSALMQGWALNYMENARADGWVAGCITPEGPDPRLHHMKPLLARGCVLAANGIGDFSWLRPHLEKLLAIVEYRHKTLWNTDYDLPVWFDSMESGADNNLASLNFPDKSVISTDVCAFTFSEYSAIVEIANALNDLDLAEQFQVRADNLCANFEKYLFSESLGIYLNLNTLSGELIPCIAYSSFVPFWLKMADPVRARRAIEGYLLNSAHLKSPYGFRTLSKADPGYNNVNMIKPHSNWQGPIWPIANYIYIKGLLNYGYKGAALECAEQTIALLKKDISTTGGMHENYDAETGEPLAAPNFVSWNILVRSMMSECLSY